MREREREKGMLDGIDDDSERVWTKRMAEKGTLKMCGSYTLLWECYYVWGCCVMDSKREDDLVFVYIHIESL